MNENFCPGGCARDLRELGESELRVTESNVTICAECYEDESECRCGNDKDPSAELCPSCQRREDYDEACVRVFEDWHDEGGVGRMPPAPRRRSW